MKDSEKKKADHAADAPKKEDAADERLHIKKSVFEINREMQQKAAEEQRQREEEIERQLAQKRKKAAEARDKRLEAERLELIRLKQGVIEESETIHEEEKKEEEKRTVFQKISSFFYLNKWWLGLAAMFGVIAVFLTYNLLTRPRPDVIILMIGENYALGEDSTLHEYVENFTEDVNGNGEILASVYYIQYSGIEQRDYANAVQNKLSAEMQSAEGVILICNEFSAEQLCFEGLFTDLSAMYPDNPHVKGDRFMLKSTDFAEKVGITKEQLGDDWFIAIREPMDLMNVKKEKMQKVYDRDFPVFDAIIKDLSE